MCLDIPYGSTNRGKGYDIYTIYFMKSFTRYVMGVAEWTSRFRTVFESTSRVNAIETFVSMAAFATQILQTLTFGLAFEGFERIYADRGFIEVLSGFYRLVSVS